MSRKSGYKVKDVTGMQNIMFDLKPNRCDSFVYSQIDLDVTELSKYIEKKKTNHSSKPFRRNLLWRKRISVGRKPTTKASRPNTPKRARCSRRTARCS